MPQQFILWLVAGAVALVIVGLIAWSSARRQRRKHMAELYGHQYDRAVAEYGGVAQAEKELALREKRFAKAHIVELSLPDRDRYAERWRSAQAHFVDDPAAAVAEADALIGEVMTQRGYPGGDFEQRLADVALAHPSLMEHYKNACDIAHRGRENKAGTEDLRQAMVHYRALFEELLVVSEGELVGTH